MGLCLTFFILCCNLWVSCLSSSLFVVLTLWHMVLVCLRLCRCTCTTQQVSATFVILDLAARKVLQEHCSSCNSSWPSPPPLLCHCLVSCPNDHDCLLLSCLALCSLLESCLVLFVLCCTVCSVSSFIACCIKLLSCLSLPCLVLCCRVLSCLALFCLA
jgi:hypothetical protein